MKRLHDKPRAHLEMKNQGVYFQDEPIKEANDLSTGCLRSVDSLDEEEVSFKKGKDRPEK